MSRVRDLWKFIWGRVNGSLLVYVECQNFVIENTKVVQNFVIENTKVVQNFVIENTKVVQNFVIENTKVVQNFVIFSIYRDI